MADNASNNKKPKAKPKIEDVTPPKKAAAVEEPKIVISSRPMIGRNISVSTPVDDVPKPETEPAAPQLTNSKRPVIAPLNAPEAAATQSTQAQSESDEEKVEKPSAEEVTPEAQSSTPDDTKEAATAPEEVPSDDAPEADTGVDDSQNSQKQPSAETKKAVEEAKRAAKRQEELEKYIDSKEFYVPINAVARKRSIKVSGLLTFLLFVLALILIDLMIDSGVILLVQKIPHTHFFTSN